MPPGHGSLSAASLAFAVCRGRLPRRSALTCHAATHKRRPFVAHLIPMSSEFPAHSPTHNSCILLATFLCAALLIQLAPASAQQVTPRGDTPSPPLASSNDQSHAADIPAIPPGTILPVRLNSTLSSASALPGQTITARIMQDVPLASGMRIKQGSKVVGHIVEAAPVAAGTPARISFQFDKLLSSHQTITITTNLLAIAGFMRIREAQLLPSVLAKATSSAG